MPNLDLRLLAAIAVLPALLMLGLIARYVPIDWRRLVVLVWCLALAYVAFLS